MRKNGGTQTLKKQVSCLNNKNKEVKISLYLLVEWMTTGDNYELWNGGTKNNREMAGLIVQFLVAHTHS
ncbi:hypothetical protein VP01_603g8 [Puccinia sorghi]|uniref:Uncharacterized protein n=1 Tax=Puccinia sorghi TaxID=27349 RepID=A0A0L6UI50_9BASI|nr:hypothetical protein VP01_603g8 [Puccinia sorghi]